MKQHNYAAVSGIHQTITRKKVFCLRTADMVQLCVPWQSKPHVWGILPFDHPRMNANSDCEEHDTTEKQVSRIVGSLSALQGVSCEVNKRLP